MQAICSWCSKFMCVRWDVAATGEVLTSHGICAECLERQIEDHNNAVTTARTKAEAGMRSLRRNG